MDNESARLERLYHDMNDEHLLALARDPDSLTADARSALDREIAARGLSVPAPLRRERSAGILDQGARPVDEEPELEQGFTPGIPGVFPSSAAIMEQALEPAGEVIDGRARLISFFDGHELSHACETLEAAGIIPEIESVGGDAMSGAPPRFDIWVRAGGLERAEALLREKMGLFPLPEVAKEPVSARDSEGEELESSITVAELESEADARHVLDLLHAQAIDARLDERRRSEDQVYAVQVDAADQQRALATVASALGVR